MERAICRVVGRLDGNSAGLVKEKTHFGGGQMQKHCGLVDWVCPDRRRCGLRVSQLDPNVSVNAAVNFVSLADLPRSLTGFKVSESDGALESAQRRGPSTYAFFLSWRAIPKFERKYASMAT